MIFPTSKPCVQCKADKPLHEFAHYLIGVHARSSKCRKCLKGYSAKRARKIRQRKINHLIVQ